MSSFFSGGGGGSGGGGVTSVNTQTGAVVLGASDVGAAPASGISPSAVTGTAVVTADSRLSNARTPTAHKTSHATGGTDALGAGDLAPGVTAGTAVVTADARLSDARTPTAHKTSHEPGGSDALTLLDNSSLKAAAAIAYSKLALTGAIVNADLAGSIAASKVVGTALVLSDAQTALQGIIFPVAAFGVGLGSSLAVWPSANRAHGLRFIVPRAGTIDDISFYVGTSSGNYDLAVVDDGSASAGNRTSLYHKGSTALAGTNVWISNNPSLVVTKGQHIDVALQVDNATATIARYANVASTQFSQLPSTYIVAPGAAPAKFAWQWPTTLPMPLPVVESGLQGTLNMPFFLVHIT